MKHIFTILLLLTFLSGCATKPVMSPKDRSQSSEVSSGTKVKKPETILIDHKYFQITYDPQRRLARSVIYTLTDTQLKNKIGSRKNKFIADPILIKNAIPYALPTEYAGSGYDRGHMAPSGDFLWNQDVNDLTFVMSNIAPQTPNLNRDSWRLLEDQVRKWACGEKKITVITGPVLSDKLLKLKSGLEIPQDFYKVVIDETPPRKIISFIYHQTDKGDVLAKRVVPISKVEEVTGMSFKEEFPEIKNEELKETSAISEWKEADCVK
jgi:endonuclease G